MYFAHDVEMATGNGRATKNYYLGLRCKYIASAISDF